MKFDIHTHHFVEKTEKNSVLNIFWNDDIQIPENQLFSLSVHPWYMKDFNYGDFINKIEENIDNQNFVAIGECGLDKNTPFSLEIQISVLNQNYILAKKYCKPMIIHCVGCFDELIRWKKDKMELPMLLHGYVKKIGQLNILIKSGFYVSFGPALVQNRPSLIDAFRSVRPEKMFLETDDQKSVNIIQIYEAAAHLKNISINELEFIIESNKNVFFNSFR